MGWGHCVSQTLFLIFSVCLEIIKPSSQGSSNQEDGGLQAMDEDYQALTSKEETDLEMLMSDTATAVSDAENFAEYLSKQLSILDGVRVSLIMIKINMCSLYNFWSGCFALYFLNFMGTQLLIVIIPPAYEVYGSI